MSYADAQLDLTAVGIACLSGPNGAGKSALLDAISWALWDTARAQGDELIRLGQTEMRVDVCFSLEGHVYRVRRSRQRIFGKSGQRVSSRGSLDFHVWSGSDDGWRLTGNGSNWSASANSSGMRNNLRSQSTRPTVKTADRAGHTAATSVQDVYQPGGSVKLHTAKDDVADSPESTMPDGELDEHDIAGDSCNAELLEDSAEVEPENSKRWTSLSASTMRDTQERLRSLLRMDYDSFVSSVYLRQGRADEFTIRSAGERKQVLAEILGLDYFERLQELARQEARDQKVRVQILETALSGATEVEKGFADSLADLDETRASLADCERNRLEVNDLIADARIRLADVNLSAMRREAALVRLDELKLDVSSLSRRYQETLSRLQNLTAVIADEQNIRIESVEFEQLKALVEDLDNTAMRFHELNSKRLELRSRIATARGRIEVEVEHFQAGLKDLVARKSKLTKSIKNKDDVEESYRAYKRLLADEQEMARKRETFASLSLRVEELHTMIVESRLRLEAEIQQKSGLLDELEQLVKSKTFLSGEQEDLRLKADELDRLESEFEFVEERGLKLKAEFDSLGQQVQSRQRHIRENEEKERELCEKPDLSSCPLCRSPIVDALAVMQRYHDENASVNREIDSLKDRMQTIEDERTHLRRQYVELRKKLEERSKLDVRIGEFNEKQSALERAETSRDELRKGVELARRKLDEQAYAQIERESLVRIKGEIARLEFDPIIFSNLQSQIRAQRHAEFRWQQLNTDLKELEQLDAEIPAKEARIDELNRGLQEENFEATARQELGELEGEIRLRPYNREEHQQRKQRLSQLLPTAERLNDLNRALIDAPLLKAAVQEMSQLIQAKQAEISRLETDLNSWNELIAQQDRIESELGDLQEQLLLCEQSREELKRKESSLDAKLEQLKAGKEELDAKRSELLSLLEDLSELQQLVEVYGKKGIQAVIIDNAIPEIEAEANRVLSRLSDNRMHVALVTRHRTARGTAIETLDILIADELGTRSYELYSGGETFKVNFSLRVALAKLLARRSGARLETLIIDEGFGSQDEQSRERLIRAINSIRNDFALILVVTHIAEVKDMFPIQIVVNKDEGLSQVQLVAL